MLNRPDAKRLRENVVKEGSIPRQLDHFWVHQVGIHVPPNELFPLNESTPERSELRPPEQVYGTPADPTCLIGVTRREYDIIPHSIFKLSNAKVIGWSAAVDDCGHLYSPGPMDTIEKLDIAARRNESNHDGFVIFDRKKIAYIGRQTEVHRKIAGLFLPFLEPGNFGSFLFRGLPRLMFASEHLPDIDCYVVPERTGWLMEALQLVGMPVRPVFTVKEVNGDVFTVLYVVAGGEQEGFFDTATATRLQVLAKRFWGRGSDANKRIYASRQLNTIGRPTYRPLRNEPEIEKHLSGQGFEIIYPETHSLAEQIRIFANASVIVGPSGSGMLNTMFARPGTRVLDMESFTTTVRQHAKIYSSTGKQYSFLFGQIEDDPSRPMLSRAWSIPFDTMKIAVSDALCCGSSM